MANTGEEVTTEYEQYFDPKEFMNFKLLGLKNYVFWFDSLYEFFTHEKLTGGRFLDLGAGPTVHNMGTASAYFDIIILSDFLEKNCEELRKWIRKDPDCIDWTPFLQMVAKSENRKDVDTACQEIEERIRSSVKDIVRCDILNDQVIPEEYAQQPFDAILTSLTLQTAATNLESHSKMIGRINRLLRNGGKLIMMGTTKCSYWSVGNVKFHSLPMTEADIVEALQVNGFGEIQIKLSCQPDSSLPFKCDKLYFVTCTKI